MDTRLKQKLKRTKSERLARDKAPEGLAHILERWGEQRYSSRPFPISIMHWRAALGPRIADKAIPYSLKSSVLEVKVASALWASELSFLEQIIKQRLERFGYYIQKFVFKVGKIELWLLPPERRRVRLIPPKVEIPQDLDHELQGIDDVTLRDSIRCAMASNMAWQNNIRPYHFEEKSNPLRKT